MSEELPPESEPEPQDSESKSPRRARSRRRRLVDAIKLPAVSGWTTSLLLFLCFLVSGLAIPMTLRLPQWIEAEIVVGTWWVIWFAVLARLLYTRSIVGTVEPYESRSAFGYGFYSGDWNPGCGNPGCLIVEGEGCLVALIVALILPGLVWLVVEVAIPCLALVLFGTIRGMLACVVNDRHQCQGHLGRSVGWAGLWATAYTVPLALLVWLIHWRVG